MPHAHELGHRNVQRDVLCGVKDQVTIANSNGTHRASGPTPRILRKPAHGAGAQSDRVPVLMCSHKYSQLAPT